MSEWLSFGDEGPRVKALQKLLNDNPYRHPRILLEPDGEWGPLTDASVRGTKYWAGYPKEELESVAGEFFFDLLSKKIALPNDYRDRREIRLKKAQDNKKEQDAADKMRLRALGIIRGELGTLETPNNSNHIKYNDFWGWGPVPYCAIGISWAWLRAGSKAFVKGLRWAGCREMLSDARMGGKGIHLTDEPQPGCPGVVDLNGDASPDHAVTFVKDIGGGYCETYEFNTSKDNTYIQGVWNKKRRLADCWWMEVEK